MKRISLYLLCTFFSLASLAQSPLLPGDAQANFGFGLNSQGLPIYGGLDYSIANNLTIGGQLGMASQYYSLTGNVNYHFDELFYLDPEWNVYAGANVGFFGSRGSDDIESGLDIGLQAGFRYFFSPKWAVNVELGGGNQVSGGKVGATFAF